MIYTLVVDGKIVTHSEITTKEDKKKINAYADFFKKLGHKVVLSEKFITEHELCEQISTKMIRERLTYKQAEKAVLCEG